MTATPIAQITSTGISSPSYNDVLTYFQDAFRAIYGNDIDIDDDSQDGQMIAVFSQVVSDANQMCVNVYNSFSPTFSQGAGLSSLVKLNGLRRLVSSNSTAPVNCVGQVGTQLNNCLIGDDLGLGTQWTIPNATDIPDSGTIEVTATCTTEGSVSVPAGHLVKILTPTAGWQSVTNPSDATPGAPVEEDPTLKARQAVSTSLPAITPVGAIKAAVANITGVQRLQVYENDTGADDADGLPAHSIAVVVEGGDITAIATAIALKKTPGTTTYGTTSVVVTDPQGVPNTINFFVLALQRMIVHVAATALTGFVSTTNPLVKSAIAQFLNGLSIGEDSYTFRLGSPAQLSGDAATEATQMTQAQLDVLSGTYLVTAITQAVSPGSPGSGDITIAFNEATSCSVDDITFSPS